MKLFIFPMLSADYECAKGYTMFAGKTLSR